MYGYRCVTGSVHLSVPAGVFTCVFPRECSLECSRGSVNLSAPTGVCTEIFTIVFQQGQEQLGISLIKCIITYRLTSKMILSWQARATMFIVASHCHSIVAPGPSVKSSTCCCCFHQHCVGVAFCNTCCFPCFCRIAPFYANITYSLTNNALL